MICYLKPQRQSERQRIARVLRQEAATAEGYPLYKEVERLAFVRRRLNCPPELDVGYVTEEKRRPDHTPEFAKCEVELVLCGTCEGTLKVGVLRHGIKTRQQSPRHEAERRLHVQHPMPTTAASTTSTM